jgi:hypothetical protein
MSVNIAASGESQTGKAVTKAQEEELLPALFWDGTEDWINEDNCADFAALQSLKYDDTTPEERAEEHKRKGNEALKYKQNKLYVRKAVQEYTLALHENFEDVKLRAVVHCNRAHAALLLGNQGKALDDAKVCVELDPLNVKGFFRAAKSSYSLGKLEECVAFCERGLEIDVANVELKSILKQAKKAVEKREVRQKQFMKTTAITDAYLGKLRQRSLKLGPPVLGAGERFPEIKETDDVASFWVLFVYPESMQTDIIEKFDERVTIGDQADEMFGVGAPPLPWDGSGSYTRDRLEFYYQTNAAPAYPESVLRNRLLRGKFAEGFPIHGDGDAVATESANAEKTWNETTRKKKLDPRDQKMVLVPESRTLGEILEDQDHVIPGHPVFYVVAKGTEFREKFLAGKWEL